MSGSVPQEIKGEVITAATGEQYFVMGKNRIKITEHFPSTGKQIEELVTELVINKMKEKVDKSA